MRYRLVGALLVILLIVGSFVAGRKYQQHKDKQAKIQECRKIMTQESIESDAFLGAAFELVMLTE